MGQEISHSHFSAEDFELFSERLREETELLHSWQADGVFSEQPLHVGFELEAWLLDEHLHPAPQNERFLQQLNHPLAVPELAQFNFELNSLPRLLQGNVFDRMYVELQNTWQRCQQSAAALQLQLASIGILPSARLADFRLENMSSLQRYSALNEQVLRMRERKPLQFSINGIDQLEIDHPDVMLEAATTSFQIHLQMPIDKAARLYNAAKVIAAPMAALSANSPFLFGKNLWSETRIPVFEQSVQVGQSDLTKRVSFGIRYAQDNILEVFDSNLSRYPILLPRVMNEPPESLAHLRLHNGTIWRWNRPLIGFDVDGTPHFRLEHRVVPSGPTLLDSIANAAFFYGLVIDMAYNVPAPESLLPFELARRNFYDCARHGLNANVVWLNGELLQVAGLCLQQLLPQAQAGLRRMQIDEAEISRWLGLIEQRVETRRNGSAWQRAWVAHYGADMTALTRAYLERQDSQMPVHSWKVKD
ncbi:MAG: glutamate-cysteine ligase family protein [Chromatiales bacterium]|jgi:gamma-glutamyl:cysteine ligase YbdK (ATP-grasp superfamily)